MSFTRLYDTRIKKALIAAGLSIPLIFGIFWYLSLTGAITITGYSGDVICAGTIDDPCYAYINFTANKDIYIYPMNKSEQVWMFKTDKRLKDIIMQRKWGNYWRTINLSKPWSSRVKYAVKFSAGKNYSIRFIGYKEDPFDDVKWSFGSIDPVWKGIGEYKVVSIAGRKYTPHALTEFHLPIKFKLYFDLHLTKNDFTKLIRKRIGKFNITAWGIDYLVNESYNVTVYDYGNCTQLIEVTNASCSDLGYEIYNSTHCFYNYACVIGSHQETRYRLVWKPIPNSFTIKANKIYVIDLWARKKPSLGFAAVDIIPKIKNYQLSKLAWWNTSWQYRRNIIITEQSGNTLTDYQVAINLTYDSDMNSDFSDIRFTYYNSTSDTETEIPYWIEDKVDGSWAYVWVKVPEIPANDNATIYVYYGNPSAASESNGENTFLFFDDFSGTSLNTSKWEKGTTGTYTVSNGELQLVGENSWGCWIKTLNYYSRPVKFMNRVKVTSNVGSNGYLKINGFEDTNNGLYIGYYNNWIIRLWVDGTWYSGETLNTQDFTTYKKLEVRWKSDSVKIYVDNSFDVEQTTNLPTITQARGFMQNYYSTETIYVDWYAIAKYADPEPSYEIGAEETSNQPPEITISSPLNQTYHTPNLNLIFKVTDEKSTIFHVKAWINDNLLYDNSSYVNNTEITINLKPYITQIGTYYVKVLANDTDENYPLTSQKIVYFTVDNLPPIVDKPKTYDENYIEQTSFSGSDKVVIRVNVTDPQGAEDIDKVLIEIIDNSSIVQVSNDTMTKIGVGYSAIWYSNYSDWQYRKQINVTEQSGNTLTDYPVAINIIYDSDMQSDFSDIRFTWYNSTSDEEVEIPYWIQKSGYSYTKLSGMNGVNALEGEFQLADINEDGVKDIIVPQLGFENIGGVWVYLSNGSYSWGSPIRVLVADEGLYRQGADDVEVADLNNDGYLDIIGGMEVAHVSIGYWNGSSFNATYNLTDVGSSYECDYVEIESDKDIVTNCEIGHSQIGIFKYRRNNTATSGYDSPVSLFVSTSYTQTGELELYDLNDDGIEDTIAYEGEEYTKPAYIVVLVSSSETSYTSHIIEVPLNFTSRPVLELGDTNGDGKKDILIAGRNETTLGIFGILTYNSSEPDYFNDFEVKHVFNFPSNGLSVEDVDNDGSLDLIVAEGDAGTSPYEVWIDYNITNGFNFVKLFSHTISDAVNLVKSIDENHYIGALYDDSVYIFTKENWVYVWVKVPEIPANDNATIYLYYGNSNATSESNQSAVCPGGAENSHCLQFKETFDNLDQWTVVSGTWSVANGYLEKTASNNVWQWLYTNVNITAPFVLEVDLHEETTIYYKLPFEWEAVDEFWGGRYWGRLFEVAGYDYYVELPSYYTTNETEGKGWLVATSDDWVHIKYVMDSYNKQHKLYREGSLIGTQPFGNETKGLSGRLVYGSYKITSGADHQGIDNITIYSFADPEPTYSIGEEETNELANAYEYNYTLPSDAVLGTWTINIYANDIQNAWGYNTTTFEVVNQPPLQPYNLTEPTDPSTYNYYVNYTFKAYITDLDGATDISTVLFESNFSGTLTNYTVTNYIAINSTTREYNITFNSLPAGYYIYRWYVNDTQNAWNVSDQQSFTINKAVSEVSLYLNGTRGDKTYELGTIANFTADTNTAYPVILYLDSNYTGWTLQSGTSPLTYITNPLTNLGIWNLTAYFEGDENYTSDSETHYFTVEDTTPPTIIFVSQSPADVSSTNIVVQDLNITYNITDAGGINASSVKLYYKTNRSSDEIVWFINGTAYSGFQECDNQTNVSSIWNFFLDYQIYPGTYNLPDEAMEAETKQHFNLDAKTDILKVRFFNVSNDKEHNYIVLDVQNQTVNTEFLRFYYCNESYTSGNPKLSDYCIEFYNLEPGMPHNYSKGSSLYWIVPLAIDSTTGKIGNVKVTPTSYILLRSSANAGGWNISYVTNISRTDTVQYSTNNGIAYSNFSGTVDMRIHQFDGSDSLWYYVCADDVNENSNCSSLRQDLLGLDNLPPTSPDVYSPTEGSYSGLISINYTESISPNAYPIANYTIYLTYLNKTTYTKIADNDLNLGYIWDSTSVPNGQYYIKVVACDNLGQCSHGYSENITIINLPSIKAELTTNAILLTTNATGCGCGPDYYCIWVQPENQTSALGIFNLTNNGTISGDFQAKLTGTPNTGWTLYLSPTSDTADAIQLTTSWQTIHSSVAVNESKLVWLFVDCDHVSIGPGVNIEFRAV